MSLSQEQKQQINNLVDCRDNIIDNVAKIQQILQIFFPEEYSVAYQFWIPQIVTALHDNDKWLPRGDKNMQQTMDRLTDKLLNDEASGVSKYIK